ncbi:hypothetical protein P7K49_029231 [Saguinus oedipus]|uniref:Uncharacterized protein n=1 Tax=Saguinus oedipus TaxID=9490 RepID=A0ABQ9U6L3_SAGOE|nr:hypothetical protein P7K49_029231 [Saguinus oedipus]
MVNFCGKMPQVDIVPGRLSEAEWMALTALEEGEDVLEHKSEEVLSLASGVWVSCPSVGGATRPSASFQQQQAEHRRMPCKAAFKRLDPAWLPRHWVRPLAKPPGPAPASPRQLSSLSSQVFLSVLRTPALHSSFPL